MAGTKIRATETAEPYVPATRSLRVLREAVDGCRGCELYRNATQGVFGEGPRDALLVLVGEIPGDQEDKAGHVFVGPAGLMLDRALDAVGIPRAKIYITNAVKHFKFERRGKRRIHQKPSADEIRACQPWLEAEFALLRPEMLVALGATAAKALFGSAFGVLKSRGRPFESDWAPWSMATVHPSSLLRAPDKAARDRAWADFLSDFKIVGRRYARQSAGK